MKRFLLLVFLISSLSTSAQSKEHAGNYERISESDTHLIRYELTLNPNGTFLFKHYRKIENEIPSEERIEYGRGSWTSNKRLIFLKVAESDLDATHTLNLNNTKARFDTKSPRDKSNRDIKTSIRIYESDIWIKGITMLKRE